MVADLHPISVYHLFAVAIYILFVFSPARVHWSFRLWRWNMTFSDTEMKELGSGTAYNTHNTTSLIRTLKYVSDILQTEEALTVKEYTHTHTHAGTSAFFYIHYCVLGMNIKIFKQKTSLELDLESDKIYLT